jgi:hypothetical protein
MDQDDPIAELVFLARAAAEAGQDWQGRLHHEWLPRVVTSQSRAALATALSTWGGAPELGDDITQAVETAVIEALAQEGYY